MKRMPTWKCTNTLLGNRHTAAPLYSMFPSFQSDEMQLHFYYLPSTLVSPVILLLVFGAPKL